MQIWWNSEVTFDRGFDSIEKKVIHQIGKGLSLNIRINMDTNVTVRLNVVFVRALGRV